MFLTKFLIMKMFVVEYTSVILWQETLYLLCRNMFLNDSLLSSSKKQHLGRNVFFKNIKQNISNHSHTSAKVVWNTFDGYSLISPMTFVYSTDSEVNLNWLNLLVVLTERAAVCVLPPRRKDTMMNHDQLVLKTPVVPGLIKRPSLLDHLYHLCASSLLLWHQYWCPDLFSAKPVS